MNTETIRSTITKLLALYPDSVRHPLIAESEDWEQTINPALEGMANLAHIRQITDGAESWDCMMRVILEAIYVLGYERGRRAKTLAFTVAEDQAE